MGRGLPFEATPSTQQAEARDDRNKDINHSIYDKRGGYDPLVMCEKVYNGL